MFVVVEYYMNKNPLTQNCRYYLKARVVFWWEVGLAAVEVFLGRLKAEHVFCVQVHTHVVGVLAVVRTHLEELMVVDGWSSMVGSSSVGLMEEKGLVDGSKRMVCRWWV